jgi:peptidoglycan hydrolase CwlO-like protein
LPQKTKNNLTLQAVIRGLLFVLAGMLIGGSLAIHVHGQGAPAPRITRQDADIIATSTRVNIMEQNLQSLVNKVDHLQSEADTTEAMGAGIGLAITLLQLLGFFAKSKQGGT